MLLYTNIGESIIEFGKQFGFNIWDWSAVVISFCSVIIAVISLIVAAYTLKSQKKTEKNTLPAINENVQLSLLAQSLRDLYDSYSMIFAIDFLLNQSDYKVAPSSHFWQLTKLDSDNIHESLFYYSESRLTPIHQLKGAIQDFNSGLSSLENLLQSKDDLVKQLEIDHLYEEIGYFITLYVRVLSETFKFNGNEIIEFLSENFFLRKLGKFTLRFLAKYCDSEDPENIILPCIDNSLASQYLSDKFVMFSELSHSSNYCKLTKSIFIEALKREVDLILLNVIQEGRPINLFSEKNESCNTNLLRFDRDSFNLFRGSMSTYLESIDIDRERLNSWIFFVYKI